MALSQVLGQEREVEDVEISFVFVVQISLHYKAWVLLSLKDCLMLKISLNTRN